MVEEDALIVVYDLVDLRLDRLPDLVECALCVKKLVAEILHIVLD